MGVFAISAKAEEAPMRTSSQVWINPGFYSLHFDREKQLRNNNIGIGVEIGFTEKHHFLAGTYINSNNSRSYYGAYLWRPLHAEFGNLHAFAGVAAGAFNGYTNYRNGGWFLAPLPVVGIEGDRVGINLSIIPTIKDRLDGAIAIQLRFRI